MLCGQLLTVQLETREYFWSPTTMIYKKSRKARADLQAA